MSEQRAGERISDIDNNSDYMNQEKKSSHSSHVHYDYRSSLDNSFNDEIPF